VDLDNPSEPDNSFPRFFQRTGSYGLYTNNDPNTLGIFGGDATNEIDLPYDINDNQWHHLVITYDSHYSEENLPDTNSYVEEVAADNPVLWLRFEDDIPQDSSGNDNWVGYGSAASIGFEKGGMGNSLYLDGTYGPGVYGCAAAPGPNEPCVGPNCIIIQDQIVFDYAFAPNDITFEMWYKCPDEQQPFATFFQQFGSWENEPRAPGVTNCYGEIRIFCGADAWHPGVSSYLDEMWHHLVVTYDEEYLGEPNTMHIQLYLDGIEKGTHTVSDPNAKLGPELSHLLIGAKNDMGNTYHCLTGHVDEFAVYEGILSPTHILRHYEAWQPRDCYEVWDRQLIPPWAEIADKDQNCYIDFYDFAAFAAEWALCRDE